MLAFAQSVISGKGMRESYKLAYPNDKGSDQTISSNATKLAKDPRVARLIQEAWEETAENLTEDAVAVKRYVLKQLIAHSKSAKQEGTKLKALELLGKSVGLFLEPDKVKAVPVTPEALKKELAGHLKLMSSATVRPFKGTRSSNASNASNAAVQPVVQPVVQVEGSAPDPS